jgi:hypothetical protein
VKILKRHETFIGVILLWNVKLTDVCHDRTARSYPFILLTNQRAIGF